MVYFSSKNISIILLLRLDNYDKFCIGGQITVVLCFLSCTIKLCFVSLNFLVNCKLLAENSVRLVITISRIIL